MREHTQKPNRTRAERALRRFLAFLDDWNQQVSPPDELAEKRYLRWKRAYFLHLTPRTTFKALFEFLGNDQHGVERYGPEFADKPFTIVQMESLYADEADITLDPLFKIRFQDGTEITCWPEEIFEGHLVEEKF